MATRKARFVDESYLRYLERKREQEARASDFGRTALVEEQPPAPAVSPAIASPATVERRPPEPAHGATVEPRAIARPAIATDAYTRVPNGILDRVLPTLHPYDQLILLRLYRLSRGFGKDECTVGYQTLAVACNMSKRQAQKSVDRLILAGWIERRSVEQGGRSRQSRGAVYGVNLPAVPTMERGTIVPGAIAGRATNKDKDINERVKGSVRAQDFSDCPDCEGRGHWYPEGFEKGVAKCKHKRMAR